MSIVWHGRYMDGREHPDITLAGNCFLKPSGGWSQALSAIPVAGLIGVLRASDRRIPIRRKSGGVVQEYQISETKQSEDAGKKGLGFRCFSMWKKGQRKNEYNDISDLPPGKDYIKELECFDNKTIYMQFSKWDVNRNRSDYDVVRIKSAYVSSDCDMVTYEHYDFKKDVLIKVDKQVKMRGLFKPGKERTLQIRCKMLTYVTVERNKKGKKRAVKMTSIVCSKIEGAGSRKICEES